LSETPHEIHNAVFVLDVVDVATVVLGDYADCYVLEVCIKEAAPDTMDAIPRREMSAAHGMRASQLCATHRGKDDMESMLYRSLLGIGFCGNESRDCKFSSVSRSILLAKQRSVTRSTHICRNIRNHSDICVCTHIVASCMLYVGIY
jgi:hypothetical protein